MSSNCYGIAREMQVIANNEGFKIYAVNKQNGKCKEGLPRFATNTVGLWAQDLWTIVNNKLLFNEENYLTSEIKKFFSLKDNFTQKVTRENPAYINKVNQLWQMFFIEDNTKTTKELTRLYNNKKNELREMQREYHIPGGNIFIVKGNKNNEVIIGKNELEFFSIEDIKSYYNVKKVTVLPQMDFHLDLFIRPLDKKRILLTDDGLTIKTLENGINKINDYISTLKDDLKREEAIRARNKMIQEIEKFRNMITQINPPKTNVVDEILRQRGFEVIRVPGRFYNDIIDDFDKKYFLKHICNFINANVIKNKNGELVYITNKSNIDNILGLTPEISKAINFSFEEEFINSIEPYIDRKHIYFIRGEEDYVAKTMLPEFQGGIHCACTEIPYGIKINPEVINDSSK